MSVEVFLDTNLFIYQLEDSDPHRAPIADAIIREGIATGNACISYQVVQECLNVLIRKADIPLDISAARAYLDHVLTPLLRVPASAHLYHRGLDIRDRYGFGFYDSLIVAAALDSGCTTLLTEDLQDGQQIEQMMVVNPFRST